MKIIGLNDYILTVHVSQCVFVVLHCFFFLSLLCNSTSVPFGFGVISVWIGKHFALFSVWQWSLYFLYWMENTFFSAFNCFELVSKMAPRLIHWSFFFVCFVFVFKLLSKSSRHMYVYQSLSIWLRLETVPRSHKRMQG